MPSGYQMTYTPEQAGEMELHLWCVEAPRVGARTGAASAPAPAPARSGGAGSSGEALGREAVPGSPFSVFCVAGDAHAANSLIDGFTKAEVVYEGKERSKKNALERQSTSGGGLPEASRVQTSQKSAHVYESGSEVGAGEVVVLRPSIADLYSNAATARDGQLKIELLAPQERTSQILTALTHVKGGLTSCVLCRSVILPPSPRGISLLPLSTRPGPPAISL